MRNVDDQAGSQVRSQVIRRLSEWLTSNKISEKVWKQVKGEGWIQVCNQLSAQVKQNIKL
jgi:hypothetical protein